MKKMKKLSLYNNDFYVQEDEFTLDIIPKYNNLTIYKDLGKLEKLSGFLTDISEQYNNNCVLLWSGGSHGNFIPIQVCKDYKKIYITNMTKELETQTILNISEFKANNIEIVDSNQLNLLIYQTRKEDEKCKIIFYMDRPTTITLSPDYVVLKRPLFLDSVDYEKLELDDYNIYINEKEKDTFKENFKYYFKLDMFDYDNLINLCIMVKNGGELFKKMLRENYSLIDRWTILDTGSTDGTVEFIKEFLVNKKGKLYREPFIDFGKSRNRCLDLAGKTCKYNLMLDDTYIIRGDLRKFLNLVRGDQFGDSFSMYIRSADNEYVSNRITISSKNLRYIFKIHEVIQFENNKNVIVPIDDAMIMDERAEYMEERTMTRKQLDLKLLFEEIAEEPDNPRHLYYVAQTYSLLHDYEKAAEYFQKRVNHPKDGFMAEKHDACFELARLYNFRLNKPWELCEKIYRQAIELDPKRPESFYFIGVHHYINGNKNEAYINFIKAYEIGYPLASQYSLKPTLSYHFLLKFLVELCYEQKNYKTGLEASELFLEKNPIGSDFYDTMINYRAIYTHLIDFENRKSEGVSPLYPNKKIIAFCCRWRF
jgi:tetratricopeptide (TPR) repeat protein